MKPLLRFWLGWGGALALILLLAGWGLAQWNLKNVTQIISDRLLLLSELRKDALQDYLLTAEAELRFWSVNPDILRAQTAFEQLWHSLDSTALAALRKRDGDSGVDAAVANEETLGLRYNALHDKLHPMTERFESHRGYYDVFLIGPEGDVYYSVEKEADFATNLEQGKWRDTGLAQAFARAKRDMAQGTIAITDMRRYAPSGDAPAIFMATALHDPAGRFLGAIAFQLPTDKIMKIMNYTSGMGETGETYLVGQDKLMRSNSRFSSESTILTQLVDTPTVSRALAGNQGVRYVKDYRGVEVMSAYTSAMVGGTRWAVLAEVDSEEIDTIAAQERPRVEGILLFVYALSLWSLWYWQGREVPGDGPEMSDLDFSGDNSGGMEG